MQKNQENFDDICNIRYLEEEENNNTKEEKEKENIKNDNKEIIEIKESIKLSEDEINRRLNFFDESSTLPKKENVNNNEINNDINNEINNNNINNNKGEDDDDLVQEKPDDDSIEDNINIKEESNINENINNEEDEKVIKNNIEEELKQNMKESETFKDSYCDKLIKNMDEYRKLINSNDS